MCEKSCLLNEFSRRRLYFIYCLVITNIYNAANSDDNFHVCRQIIFVFCWQRIKRTKISFLTLMWTVVMWSPSLWRWNMLGILHYIFCNVESFIPTFSPSFQLRSALSLHPGTCLPIIMPILPQWCLPIILPILPQWCSNERQKLIVYCTLREKKANGICWWNKTVYWDFFQTSRYCCVFVLICEFRCLLKLRQIAFLDWKPIDILSTDYHIFIRFFIKSLEIVHEKQLIKRTYLYLCTFIYQLHVKSKYWNSCPVFQ